jgi:hypothetical protein
LELGPIESVVGALPVEVGIKGFRQLNLSIHLRGAVEAGLLSSDGWRVSLAGSVMIHGFEIANGRTI